MSAQMIGFSILLIGILLLLGKAIRLNLNIFQKYFLPSSILAGFIGLLAGPEVLGKLVSRFIDEGSRFANGVFPQDVIDVWSTLPALLINVIFAALFLGNKIPGVKKIWHMAGPQAAFGQALGWGQYVIGLGLTLAILIPFYDMSPLAGALIEIGFQGGHGTSAGLSETFQELDFADGKDLALGLATVGVVSGVVVGIILINWGVRKNKTAILENPDNLPENELRGITEPEERPSAGALTTRPQSIEPLAFHLAVIGVAILIGKLLLEGLVYLEQNTWGADGGTEIMTYVPLFPLAMIGGVFLQLIIDRTDKLKLVDRKMILRLQGLALDFLIVSAIASLSLSIIGNNLVPFLTLALSAMAWNILAFMFLAPRIFPKYWFERGIGDFGQSMGMTAAGLMLIKIADSKGETKAMEAFGYKQMLFEPVLGGGLFTAASMPLIYQFGAVPVLIGCSLLLAVWLSIGIFYFGKQKDPQSEEQQTKEQQSDDG